MTAWRLLRTGPRPGAWNMACDLAILAAVDRHESPPTLRFYGWDPPAVSFGRHQLPPDPAAAAVLAARRVEWVRRPTGGRAVFHGPPAQEFTYSVAASLRAPFAATARDAYRRIHVALAAGLRRLGVPAELAPPRRVLRPTAIHPHSPLMCFAVSVPYEITAGGRKLVGSAQRLAREAILQHGSIPLAGDQAILADAWPESGATGADRATSVAAAIGKRLAFEEVAEGLAEAFARSLEVRLIPGALTRSEMEGIEKPSVALDTL